MRTQMDYDFDLSEYSNYNKKNNVILKPGFIIINRYILKQKLKISLLAI